MAIGVLRLVLVVAVRCGVAGRKRQCASGGGVLVVVSACN
jgi:hypothetical protein